MTTSNAVQHHYSRPNLTARVDAALYTAGLTDTPIDPKALAPLDQFHARGLAATAELADALALAGGEMVLDVGCGLGGPARFLAITYGCHVTGIDLTPAYIDVAQMLSERTGLSDLLTFAAGDACAMPFAAAQFDHAWTQHVAMNIADKTALYAEIARVLKPGGRLAIYDAVRGENGPVMYPVPWAADETLSFLATPPDVSAALEAAGFGVVSSADTTAQALAWFAGLPKSGNAPALSLVSVLGTEGGTGQAVTNFARNLAEGRVGLLQVVAQKL